MKGVIKDTICIVSSLIGVVVLTVVVVGSPMYLLSKYQCKGYAGVLGFEYKYSLATKCVVKTPQGWVRSNKYIISKEVR